MTVSAYRDYPSSRQPELRLFASFRPLATPAPLQLAMHGWHGSAKAEHRDNVAAPATERFFQVYPDMRGRGDSHGWPDANGLELQDAVDALAAARQLYPDLVTDADPHLTGGSGGGGNVLGLVGKFPDLFASAVCQCGISDYALWFAHDSVGEFRDELRNAGWVGGTPHTNAEAYLARGGRSTARNRMTPLLIIHGDADPRVPFEQAEAYMAALEHAGRAESASLLRLPGVGKPNHFSNITEAMDADRHARIHAHVAAHRVAPTLPESGSLVVAGFLATRRFTVTLESVDHVALLDYDLSTGCYELWAPSSRFAVIHEGDRAAQLLTCAPLSLAAFCSAVGHPDPRTYTL